MRDPGLLEQRLLVGARPAPGAVEGRVRALQRAQRLLQRLGEVEADRHRLADRLHVGGQGRVGEPGTSSNAEPRHLHHDVIQGQLNDAGVSGAGDVAGDLVERVAGSPPWPRSWRSGSPWPSRPGRWSATRVHLDDDHAAVASGLAGELDVAAPVYDAHGADDADREVAQVLVLAVGESPWPGAAVVVETSSCTPMGRKIIESGQAVTHVCPHNTLRATFLFFGASFSYICLARHRWSR